MPVSSSAKKHYNFVSTQNLSMFQEFSKENLCATVESEISALAGTPTDRRRRRTRTGIRERNFREDAIEISELSLSLSEVREEKKK